MKIRRMLAALAVAVMAAGSAAAQGAQAKSRVLVVYFSRADENYGVGTVREGNTAVLARMIAEKTGADTFEIVPQQAYPAAYRACTDVAKQEQRDRARPAYKGDIDTSGYGTVFVGYPIWWGDLPMVVHTFLEAHDLSGKTVIPFCTHEGSGLSGTDGAIRRLYRAAQVREALSMRGATAQNKRDDAEKQVDAWLKKLSL